MKRTCIKSLYKSTYLANAFVEGRTYEVVETDKFYVWIKDETGRPFNFRTGAIDETSHIVGRATTYAEAEYFA